MLRDAICELMRLNRACAKSFTAVTSRSVGVITEEAFEA